MRVIEKNSYSVVIKKPCPDGRNRENFFVFVTFYTVGISGGCASVCNAPRRFSYMPYFYCFFDIIHSAGPIFLNSSFVVRWIYVVYLVPDIATHLFASRAHWDKHKSYLHHANDYTIVSRGREQPTLRRILAVKSHIRRCRSSPKTRAAQNWPKLPDPSLSPLNFQRWRDRENAVSSDEPLSALPQKTRSWRILLWFTSTVPDSPLFAFLSIFVCSLRSVTSFTGVTHQLVTWMSTFNSTTIWPLATCGFNSYRFPHHHGLPR